MNRSSEQAHEFAIDIARRGLTTDYLIYVARNFFALQQCVRCTTAV